MFIIFLKFAENKGKAGEFMEAHKAWIAQGFENGVFMLVGSLQPGLGGAILANGISKTELEGRLAEDPFVDEGIVTVEINELQPARANDAFSFLLTA